METNEIMVKDGIIEAVEEIAAVDSNKNLKIAAGIGLLIIGGVAAYRFAIKPMIAKIKAKKEKTCAVVETADEEIIDETDDESEEIE